MGPAEPNKRPSLLGSAATTSPSHFSPCHFTLIKLPNIVVYKGLHVIDKTKWKKGPTNESAESVPYHVEQSLSSQALLMHKHY